MSSLLEIAQSIGGSNTAISSNAATFCLKFKDTTGFSICKNTAIRMDNADSAIEDRIREVLDVLILEECSVAKVEIVNVPELGSEPPVDVLTIRRPTVDKIVEEVLLWVNENRRKYVYAGEIKGININKGKIQ